MGRWPKGKWEAKIIFTYLCVSLVLPLVLFWHMAPLFGSICPRRDRGQGVLNEEKRSDMHHCCWVHPILPPSHSGSLPILTQSCSQSSHSILIPTNSLRLPPLSSRLPFISAIALDGLQQQSQHHFTFPTAASQKAQGVLFCDSVGLTACQKTSSSSTACSWDWAGNLRKRHFYKLSLHIY